MCLHIADLVFAGVGEVGIIAGNPFVCLMLLDFP